ncbi:MAG: STAS domain-containing protein [Hydrogenovibrio sp.]|nr:STAS domain-containing protein [Hydrogenovibrio sp.]
MNVSSEIKNGVLKMAVQGSFDLGTYDEFTHAIPKSADEVSSVEIDLSNTVFIDSSAIGMILSLREFLGQKKPITLLKPNGNVKALLDVAQLGSIMTIKS